MNEYYKKLGDVIAINPESVGINFPYKNIEYVDISSVGSGTINNVKTVTINDAPSRAKRIVANGDTIISTVRPNRRSFLYIKNPPPNMIVSTGFAVLRPSDKIDSRYLYSVVRNQEFTDYLTNNAKGAAYPAVDTETIHNAKIHLPPLSTQRKIAAILSAYDDLIENNTRRIQILEEMAQMIYRHWFVDFKFPGHEQVRLIDSGTELGLVPEGWELSTLGDTCNLVMGQSPSSQYYNEMGIGLPFHQGVSAFGNRYPEDKIFCTIENRIAERDDILFSVRAPVGRMNISNKKIIIGRGLCSIRNKKGYQWYTFHQLREIFFKEDIIGGGTIFKSVTRQDMENIKLLYPNRKDILDRFEEFVCIISQEIYHLTEMNKNLQTTRDMLLPILVNGQMNVNF
jgi:type I restriction enzyme, S subunit